MKKIWIKIILKIILISFLIFFTGHVETYKNEILFKMNLKWISIFKIFLREIKELWKYFNF